MCVLCIHVAPWEGGRLKYVCVSANMHVLCARTPFCVPACTCVLCISLSLCVYVCACACIVCVHLSVLTFCTTVVYCLLDGSSLNQNLHSILKDYAKLAFYSTAFPNVLTRILTESWQMILKCFESSSSHLFRLREISSLFAPADFLQ